MSQPVQERRLCNLIGNSSRLLEIEAIRVAQFREAWEEIKTSAFTGSAVSSQASWSATEGQRVAELQIQLHRRILMVSPLDNATYVQIVTLPYLAKEKIHITALASEASEVIAIDIWASYGSKAVIIKPQRMFSDKIVYLKYPESLKQSFCLRCGHKKVSPDWLYCADSFCQNPEDKVMLDYIKKLLRDYGV